MLQVAGSREIAEEEDRHVALARARSYLSDFGIAFEPDAAVAQPEWDETGPEHVAGFVDGDHGERRRRCFCGWELAGGGTSAWTGICGRGCGDFRRWTVVALVGGDHPRPIFYRRCNDPKRP